MIPVVWLKARPLCDDQHLINLLLADTRFDHRTVGPPSVGGAVVVCPARYYTPTEINDYISGLDWCLLILTSDEESTFDHQAIDHPNCRVWVMTPRPGQHEPSPRFLGEGFNPETRTILHGIGHPQRTTDVFFSGQDTHQRRHALFTALNKLPAKRIRIDAHRTEGFMQGMDRAEYLARMATTRLAPCPSGPATVDSFRLYEALEAGAVPIADAVCPAYTEPGYWHLLFGEEPPFPIIGDWGDLPKYVAAELKEWPANAVACSSWWQQTKRRWRNRLFDDVAELHLPLPDRDVNDQVTVLIPTSPIPSHPSTSIIEATVASIRDRLPSAEILVMCDGVRLEQSDRRADYLSYLHRLMWLCNHEWHNVVPFVFGEHHHQARMTRQMLPEVRTPLVMFVEHDTPLIGDVDWEACGRAVLSGRVNLIRFHHEANVLEPHQHLMLDVEPSDVEGAPLLRTVQWSQRPHLASTGYYRTLMDSTFWRDEDGMIEDRMFGVVENAWRDHGFSGWDQHRLAMYAPPGDIKRSTHLDGRGDDPKMVYLTWPE